MIIFQFFMFQPVALKNLGLTNESAICFVKDLGRKILAVFSEAREGVFLFQRLSVLIQCLMPFLFVTILARFSHRNSVRPSVLPSVRLSDTVRSVKNGAS